MTVGGSTHSLCVRPVDAGAGDLQKSRFQPVAQCLQPVNRSIFKRDHGQLRGLGKGHNAGHVLCAGAAAAFVAAAHQQRLNRSPAAYKHCADALGPMHLVRADRAEVAAKAAHVELNLARALHGVDMKENAGFLGDLADLLHRLQYAGLNPLGLGATKVVSTPLLAKRRAASRIAECSIAVVTKWSPGRSKPKSAVLSPSVPPELKTTSAAWQFMKSAIVVRARSTAACACCPCKWIEDALPKCSIQYGRMASITSGSRGVVAFAYM
jgi:hypothetical protein